MLEEEMGRLFEEMGRMVEEEMERILEGGPAAALGQRLAVRGG